MGVPEESVRKKPRVLTTVVIICAALFLTGGVIGGVYFANTGATTPNETEPTEITPEKITDVPQIDVSYMNEEQEIVLTVNDLGNRKVEYLVQDQNHKDLVNDFTNRETTTIPVTLTSGYRIKARFVDSENTDFVGGWSKSVSLTNDSVDSEGSKQTLTLNPAYHETAWARGEGGLDNLRTALTVAFSASELTLDVSSQGCLQLNYGTISPGLMLAPEPATIMKNTQLYYSLQEWDDATSTGVITYGWCQN